MHKYTGKIRYVDPALLDSASFFIPLIHCAVGAGIFRISKGFLSRIREIFVCFFFLCG